MDVLDGCDVCGGGHTTEQCPELGLENTEFEEAVLTRARLTLPHFARAVNHPNGEVSVIAQADIPKKSQFGPYEAKKTTHEFSDEGLFMLKILVRDGTSVSLDTTEESECNWMCLIRAASNQEEQNCMAYQLGTSIYYNTIKDIPVGHELLVWYAPQYARKLGKSVTPDGISKVMLNMKVIYPSVDDLPESKSFSTFKETSYTQESPVKFTLPNQLEEEISPDKNNATPDSATPQQQDDVASAEFDDVPIWKCKSCSKIFNYEKEFARHIMIHLSEKKPNQSRRGRPRKHPVIIKTERDSDNEEIESAHDAVDDGNYDPALVIDFANKRVQPKRSLKGRRSEGYMADFIVPKIEIKQELETEEVEKEKTTPAEPKRRGRKRKAIQETETQTFNGKVTAENNLSKTANKNRPPVINLDKQIVKRDQQKPMSKVMKKRKTKDNEEIADGISEKGKDTSKSKPVAKSQVAVETDDFSKNTDVIYVETEAAAENTKRPIDEMRTLTGKRKKTEKLSVTELSVVGIPGQEDTTLRVEIQKPLPICKTVENSIDTNGDTESSGILKDGIGCTSKPSPEIIQNSLEKMVTEIGIEISENVTEEKQPEMQDSEVCGKDNSHLDDLDNKINQTDINNLTDLQESNSREEDTENNNEENVGEDNQKLPEIADEEETTEDIHDNVEGEGGKIQKKNKYKHTCHVCKKNFTSKHYLKLHMPRHTGKFKCDFCGFFYARKESLLKHDCKMKKVISVLQDGKGYECNRCQKFMINIEDARDHFADHAKEVTCSGCNQVFATRNLCNDHSCSNTKVYDCEICKQKFTNEKSLFRHMAMHTDIFTCESCNKSYARKDSLIKHMLKCCPDQTSEYKVYACKKCRKGFATKLGVDNHEARCTMDMCANCKKVFQSTEHMLKHLPHCMGKANSCERVRYSCNACGKSFLNQAYLSRHQETHSQNFKCSTCDKIFMGQEEMNKHEKFCSAEATIQLEGSIKCDICSEVFENAKYYKDHYIKHTHPYHCEKCGKYFIKIGTLHTHDCNIEPKAHRCPVCSKVFSSSKYCQIHQKVQHNIQLHCDRCNASFEDKKSYLYHMCRDDDGNEKPFSKLSTDIDKHVCHVCGRDFVSTSNLNKHMKIHGEKNVTCPICNKKFHHSEYLKVHIEGKHEKRQRFQCSECGKVLTSKPGLITHVKNFHAETKTVYPCPKCGKMFSQKGNMKTHMYSHATDRAFRCTHCDKTFKYPDQLNKHLLNHTMEEKFECDLCDKQFTKEYDLRRHKENFHSGMMYICHICNSRCGHRHTLFRHYKRKHPEEFHLMKNDEFVNSLFQQVEPNFESVSMTTIEIQGHEDEIEEEERELTQFSTTNFVPHAAAEALQSLSNTIMTPNIQGVDVNGILNSEGAIINLPGLDGSYQIQTVPHNLEGAQGDNTVVILQIVNPQEEGEIQQEYQVQEIIEAEDEAGSQGILEAHHQDMLEAHTQDMVETQSQEMVEQHGMVEHVEYIENV